MRHWTAEEREAQRKKIHEHKPWKNAGVKTPEGKARSSKNALKHGGYSAEMEAFRMYVRNARALIREVKEAMK